MTTEQQAQILQDIKDFVCTDYLNQHDPSVGIYAVDKLDKDVIYDIEESFIKVIWYTPDKALLEVDNVQVELFVNDNEKWDVRIVEYF